MICDFNRKFKNDFGNLVRQLETEKQSAEQKRSAAINFLRTVKKESVDAGYSDISQYISDWAKFVDWRLEKSGVPALGAVTIQDIILNPEQNITQNTVITTEKIDQDYSKNKINKDFLDKIYDGADQVRVQAVKQINFNLSNSMLFDRLNGTITKSNAELNQNLRNYQQQLFNNIYTFLRNYYKKSKNQVVGESYDIYAEENAPLLYKDGKYTKVFDSIIPTANNIFNTFTGKRLISEYTYQTQALKAFNDYQTLLHFDEFLKNAFGDLIQISNNLKFSDEYKYSIQSKATNMFWANNADDDIDVTKSTNNISKLLVTSTRLYDFNFGTLIPDSYLNYGQFVTLISKLKDLSMSNLETKSLLLNQKIAGKRVISLDSLSLESQNYINSLGTKATLATLINKTRNFPRQAYTALFELLTSNNLRPNFNSILKQFSIEEKNVLMSLGKEIFNNNGNSLRRVQDLNGYDSSDYFSTILQTSDSTWLVKNCSYIEDQDTKQTVLKTLLSSNVQNMQRGLNDSLNTLNTPEDKIGYNATYSKSGFEFEFNGKKVKIDNLGKVSIDGGDITKEFLDQSVPFIDSMLHQNFINNPKYLENFVQVSGGYRQNAMQSLFKFAAELLHGQYALKYINDKLDQNIDTNLSKLDRITKYAKEVYPEEYYGEPKVSQKYSNIDIIPSKQLNTLENLAEAKAITDGATTATQVKDAENKALSTSTPSRLLSDFPIQFELIRENTQCPAFGFSIIQDPRTLVDVQTVREIKTADGETKTYNQLNTREFLESTILYDLFSPLINNTNKKGDLVTRGYFSFTPSVNSDKNTISKAVINLKSELSKLINDQGLPLYSNPDTIIEDFFSDANNYPLLEYISSQLEGYYKKLYRKLNSDLQLLSNSETWKKTLPGVVLDYYESSFNKFNQKVSELGLSARQIIDQASRETGIKINEQLHVIFKGNKILVNPSIIELTERYRDLDSLKTFFNYKNTELLQALINNGVIVDCTKNLKILNYLEEHNLKDWISNSGQLVYAKYKTNDGQLIDLSSEKDFLILESLDEIASQLNGQSLKYNPHLLQGHIIMNPMIEKENMLNYLYSQEFILSTVGSHVNHPNKNVGNGLKTFDQIIADEAARYQAQHKRNVSNTASMHEFLLNQKTGIPNQYNIAVIQDINDLVYNIGGDISEVKPFDGATIVNPFIVKLENNSLNGEKAGIHKKQFVHFYDEPTGTGGIIKTAGFGITNSLMRNSPFLERMMKNMTDYQWTDNNGNPIMIDITKQYQNYIGDNIPNFYNIFYKKSYLDKGVWKDKYYKVQNIIPKIENGVFNGYYDLQVTQVNNNGVPIGESMLVPVNQQINSNYRLWKYIFGGLDSVSLDGGILNSKGNAGEASINNVVKAMNSCGILLSGDKPYDQSNFYQPMKHSDTHYLVTEGAIKQGAANFNTKDWYYKDGQYNRFSIKANQAGIQLDKEHHADDSEISMMTQVVSACAALGYTWNEANKMYQALYSLTQQGIKPLLDPLMNILQVQDNKEDFSKMIAGLLVKSLGNSSKSKDGVIVTVTQNLIDKYKAGQELTTKDIEDNPIAVSDPVLFNKVQSMLSSILTSSAIKLKFKGILSVLVPSHEIMKLYGGRLKSDFVNFEEEIKEMQAKQPIIGITDVQIGRTYNVIDQNGNVIDRIHIQAPILDSKPNVYGDPNLKYIGYYDTRDLYGNYQFQEDITQGRNLGAYFCTFDGTYVDETGNVITQKFNFYDLQDSMNLYKNLVDPKLGRLSLQSTLANLKEGNVVKVGLNGQEVTISNLNIIPYEVIMPKTMATQLGLTSEDNLYDLVNDTNSFKKKFIKNLANKITDESAFTVSLKKLNGQHLYILSKDQLDKLHPQVKEEQIYSPITDPVDGKVYRVDADGNKIYSMSSINDKVYTIDGQEVIVTDNINYYLDNAQYNLLYVSDKASAEEFNSILKYSKSSNNRNLKKWRNNIIQDGNYREARDRNRMLSNIQINSDGQYVYNNTIINSQITDIIDKLGAELYSSFKKSLDIIAARIPAQSMQSFMPMKVVGYEDFDINTAYVSTHQIWLQGSDYDIDAVSLLTFELGQDGKFVGWSPYFDLSSEESLRESTNFNYPTGEKVTRVPLQKVAKDGNDVANYLTMLFSSYSFIKENNMPVLFENDNTLSYRVNMINRVSEEGLLDFESLSDSDKQNLTKIFNNEFDTNFTPDQIQSLFTQIETIINNHNLYINSPNVESFTKNYVVEQMFRIAMNPANLLQAQTSVDATTGEPKKIANQSEAGKALQYATPGNMANIYQSIEDNHVGKEVIGISAVGLKSFFALTQYANTLLNSGNEEAINRLLDRPITFNGKQYYTIANANYKGNNLEILNKLHSMSGMDAALEISALLSLATDNAKELCLAKLNANSKMAGMYIYGLTMGISFEDLGNLLMSDVGNTVASLLKGSILTDNLGIGNIDQALSYLENPASYILEHLGSEKLYDYNTGKKNSTSILVAARKSFLSSIKGRQVNGKMVHKFDDYIKELQNSLTGIEQTLPSKETVITQKASIQQVIQELNSYRRFILSTNLDNGTSNSVKVNLKLNKFVANNFIDNIIQGMIAYDRVQRSGKSKLQDFITLHEGAEEMNKLGRLLGANQGVKNSNADYLKYVQGLENLIKDRIKISNKYHKSADKIENPEIDFQKFMLDQEYRQQKINDYEKVKFSFNPLDVIFTVPHQNGYIEAVFVKHGISKAASIKYRTIYKYLDQGTKFGLNTDDTIKSLSNLCDYKSINKYLSTKSFILPAGQKVVYLQDTSTSKKVETPDNLRVYLGNNGGNATFKNWVEKQVIPDLKEGYTDSNHSFKSPIIKNNEFIRSLRPNIYSKNPSMNNSISYTTSINMSPRNDEDRLVLYRIRQEFDSLNTSYNNIPIKDIFYWYNLISYGGRQGQGTLTSIFDNYINTGEPIQYRKMLKEEDLSGNTYDLTNEELRNWLTPIGNPYTSRSKYVRYRNKDQLRVDILVQDNSNDDDISVQQVHYGKYIVNNTMTNIDQNLILTVPIQGDIRTIDLSTNDGTKYQIFVNDVSRNIFNIKVDGLESTKLDKIKKFLKEHSNLYIGYNPNIQDYVVKQNELSKFIEHQINCE